MLLSAVMKLDGGAFTTPLGKALEGIKSVVRISSDLGQKLQAAFDMGGALSDLESQTGELPGTIKILQQAFQDTGVGADSLGQTLALMRKAMGGVNEMGEPTGKIFKQLGLDIEALKGQNAIDQLKAVSASIQNLSTPAEQTTASMAIFGRSGNAMLTFLKDSSAIDTAAASLGGLPGLMNKNAAAFDAVSDRIGRIKNKTQGLWAGIAEGLLPLADSISATLDGIDLTAVGQRIGAFFGTLVELFKSANLGQILKDAIVVGLAEAINWSVTGLVKLGGFLWKALATPLSYISAAFGKIFQEVNAAIQNISGYLIKAFSTPITYITAMWTKLFQEIMEQIAKIPVIGEKLGIKKGFKAESYSDIRRRQEASMQDWGEEKIQVKAQSYEDIRKSDEAIYNAIGDAALNFGKVTVFGAEEARARLGAAWDDASERFAEKLESIQTSAQPKKVIGSGTLEATKDRKAPEIPSDQLARIGGFVGATQNKMEGLAERTARATEKMVTLLSAKTGASKIVPVWGAA